MKFKIFFIQLCASAVMLLPSLSQAQCPDHRPTTSMIYKVQKTEYVRTLNVTDLADLHTNNGANTVLGLAGGEVGIRFQATFKAEPVGNNVYCLNLKKINAEFYAEPKVHIAKNFRRGTCEYHAVLKHENEHVEILKQAHKEYLPKYRQHLRNISRDVKVLQPLTLDQVTAEKQKLIQKIGTDLTAYLSIIMDDVAQRQSDFDTEEEYQRIHDRCDRWEKRLSSK